MNNVMNQLLQSFLDDYYVPTDPMYTVNETISGNPGAVTGAGNETMTGIDAMFEEKWPLGRYVFIYAVTSWVLATFPLFVYLWTNKLPIGAAFDWIVDIHALCWWPTAIIHIALSLWDSEFTRRAFEIAVLISVAGPLFLYWVGLARMFMYSDAFNSKSRDLMQEDCILVAKNGKCQRWIGDNLDMYMKPGSYDPKNPPTPNNDWMNVSKYNIWKEWRLWLSTIIYFFYSCMMVWYVIIFAPKVLEWI